MVNMISNNNNLNSSGDMVRKGLMPIPPAAVTGLVGIANTTAQNVGDRIKNLSEIRNYLQPKTMDLPPGVCHYDHIIEMIRGLDLRDDGITMNQKIKSIETDFCNIVNDENMLCESMEYINDKALKDEETALKFALLFASCNFDVLAMKELKVRTVMLNLLQKNFINSETFRVNDRERLYNSITLLGEYYHRARLPNNSPINILGESLLGLLIREVKEEKNANDVKLAKLVLSQITLNGNSLRNLHKAEITELLYYIRKNLIEQPNLKATVKAVMLMTLDLFYSNFASLGSELEIMYTKYFLMEDDDEGNNNQNSNQHQMHAKSGKISKDADYTCPSTQIKEEQNDEVSVPSSLNSSKYENGNSANVDDDIESIPVRLEDWSEDANEKCELQDYLERSQKDDQQIAYNYRYDNDCDRQSRNSIRSYQPSQPPRPLKQNFSNKESFHNNRRSYKSGNEEHDESKPLPRWRAPRFNRENRSSNQQNIRKDGNCLRLYTLNDRLKHSLEKLQQQEQPDNIPQWNAEVTNSKLVLKARQTAEYMKYRLKN